MNRAMRTAVLALLAGASIAEAGAPRAARVYYCDPVRGKVNWPGTAQQPWGRLDEVVAAGRLELRDREGRILNAGVVGSGDTILLRSGYHGEIRIGAGFNKEFVTIAAEEGQSPTAGRLEIDGGRRWLVRGLTISTSLAPEAPSTPGHLAMLGERGPADSGELVIENCFLYGVPDSSKWTAEDWIKRAPSGIWLGRHGKGHVARNNFVLNTRFGINLCAEEAVCEGNVVANFSGDGIRVTKDGQRVQHNVVRNAFVGDKDGDANHDDGIQAFLFNKGTGTMRGVSVLENIVVYRDLPGLPWPNAMQGIGFFDGPLIDFKVEGNVVLTNHWHGISLADAQGCRIVGNACFGQRAKGDPVRPPWIQLGQKQGAAKGNTVTDNLACSYDFAADRDVRSERNRNATADSFYRRFAELEAVIARKYGRVHPVAKRARIEVGRDGRPPGP